MSLPNDNLEKRLSFVKGYQAQHTFKIDTSLNDSQDLRRYIDAMLISSSELDNLSTAELPSKSEKYLNTWVKVQAMKLRKTVESIDNNVVAVDRNRSMKSFILSELDFIQKL